MGSFEIRFQFGMSSLNDHIRRISSSMCVYWRFFHFLQFVDHSIRYSVNAALPFTFIIGTHGVQ